MADPRKAARKKEKIYRLDEGFVQVGERVQLHPATDDWMRGDKFGTITRVGTQLVSVKLDKSGRTKRYRPNNLIPSGSAERRHA
jgi:hypothetical protein